MTMLRNYYVTLAISFSIFSSISASEKILIITHAFCRPDFIEIQAKTFKKFMLDEYEFVVFNDANNPRIKQKVIDACNKHSVRCVNIPPEVHGSRQQPSERTSDSIQYSLDILGFDHDGIVCILDSDMFLIKPFSFKNFLKDFDLMGVPQTRGHVNYLWNGLVIFKMNVLPNKRSIDFNCGWIEAQPTDTGGQTYYYLKNNPSLKIKYCPETSSYWLPSTNEELKSLGFDNVTIDFIHLLKIDPASGMSFDGDNHFLHYYAGGNWNRKSEDYHRNKTKMLNDYINKILN